jgi:SEC-C motif
MGADMVFEVHRDSQKLFATIPNGDRTDRYAGTLSVCSNPICRCRAVHLVFVPQPLQEGWRHNQKAERKASFDLDINGVYPEFRQTASKEDIAFCDSLLTEMDERDFRLLGHLHFKVKNQITEEAEPSTIDAPFNFADIESSAQMQVYNDILPFGDRFLVILDGVEHMLLDQHCVRTGCDCTETYIELSPILSDGNPGEHAGTILLDYASRRWKTVADAAAPHDLPALKQRVEETFPDFYARLSRRHAKLQAIYGHCRKRHLATKREAKMTLRAKVGRNDLCPCGSGRKYKKCCMA